MRGGGAKDKVMAKNKLHFRENNGCTSPQLITMWIQVILYFAVVNKISMAINLYKVYLSI